MMMMNWGEPSDTIFLRQALGPKQEGCSYMAQDFSIKEALPGFTEVLD